VQVRYARTWTGLSVRGSIPKQTEKKQKKKKNKKQTNTKPKRQGKRKKEVGSEKLLGTVWPRQNKAHIE